MTLFQILSVVAVAFALVLLYILAKYNGFIKLSNRVKTDFADIDVQLRRRAALIQNLVDLVREYASHENKTFTKVSKARAALDNSHSTKETAEADNMLTETLRSLIMVTEAYPELKASDNYKQLRNDLVEAEDLIAKYREDYNSTAERYNNATQVFPALLVANLFGFEETQLFQPADSVAFKVEKETK